MLFDTKSYLKSNRYHTPKHPLREKLDVHLQHESSSKIEKLEGKKRKINNKQKDNVGRMGLGSELLIYS